MGHYLNPGDEGFSIKCLTRETDDKESKPQMNNH